jgi:hypothetical protein
VCLVRYTCPDNVPNIVQGREDAIILSRGRILTWRLTSTTGSGAGWTVGFTGSGSSPAVWLDNRFSLCGSSKPSHVVSTPLLLLSRLWYRRRYRRPNLSLHRSTGRPTRVLKYCRPVISTPHYGLATANGPGRAKIAVRGRGRSTLAFRRLNRRTLSSVALARSCATHPPLHALISPVSVSLRCSP